jgi:predicted cupin superfamily sugar epimerase
VTASEIIAQLSLEPHPEGGWYREFYRSQARVQAPYGERCAVTSIHYLLERQQMSRWHVVNSDEIWHFGGGSPLELLTYDPESSHLTRRLLSDAANGSGLSVIVVPGRVWQAARSLGDYSLAGCSVAPGFEFADFQFVRSLPHHLPHFEDRLAQFKALL